MRIKTHQDVISIKYDFLARQLWEHSPDLRVNGYAEWAGSIITLVAEHYNNLVSDIEVCTSLVCGLAEPWWDAHRLSEDDLRRRISDWAPRIREVARLANARQQATAIRWMGYKRLYIHKED